MYSSPAGLQLDQVPKKLGSNMLATSRYASASNLSALSMAACSLRCASSWSSFSPLLLSYLFLAFWDHILIISNKPSMAPTGVVILSVVICSSRSSAKVHRFLWIILFRSSSALILLMIASKLSSLSSSAYVTLFYSIS
mgnify:CR=1 FL=1